MNGTRRNAGRVGGRDPGTRLRALPILIAALALAGCGDLSLNNALINESPGEFRLSPETVNLPVGREFTFTAAGGFTPYRYEILAGLGAVTKNQSWVYRAPEDIGDEDFIEVVILATDQLGASDTALVRVFKPLFLNPSNAQTLQLGGVLVIRASGGVPPYDWLLNGAKVSEAGSEYAFSASSAGEYTVGAIDAIGNYEEVALTVVPPNAPLTIDPNSAGVQVDGTVEFQAFGGTPPYAWSADSGEILATDPDSAVFTAPSVPATVTVTLSDAGGASVAATVTVVANPVLPLQLTPDSPTVAAVGDTVQFSACGGLPPYRFGSAPAPHGSIDPVSGLYTQKTAGKDVQVFVTDAVGKTDKTFVRWAGP